MDALSCKRSEEDAQTEMVGDSHKEPAAQILPVKTRNHTWIVGDSRADA